MSSFLSLLIHPARFVVAVIALCIAASSSAQVVQGRKEQRLALVIGNGTYKSSPLTNPINDARSMADALTATGFTVMRKENASLKEMTLALRDFGDRLKKGGVGLFYYAGHGMAVKGRNFLIPVDAEIAREDEIAFNALDANAVLDKMESAGNRLNLVLLDACRHNPFARSFRSASQGLAQMDAPVGTLVSFATAPGQVASDGNGKNGLYTQHLLANMTRPGLKIEDLFKAVRVNVRKDSNGQQVPWEASSLEGDFYFVTAAPSPAPAQAAAPASASSAVVAASSRREQKPDPRTGSSAGNAPKSVAPALANASPTAATPTPLTAARTILFPPGAPVVHNGDSWTYRHTDLKNNQTREVTNLIEEVLPDRIRFRGGNYETDLNQSITFDRSRQKEKVTESRFDPGLPMMLFPARVGESKTGTLIVSRSDAADKVEQQYVIKVLRREKVTVPAGKFGAPLQ